MTLDTDQSFLDQAIDLAKQSVINGGGPFGAVVVKDNKIIGQGSNQVTQINDPTAHAEIIAIREACKTINHFDLTGCTLYASCEPCPMCFSAIHWSRIDRIVYAATGEDAANAGFDDTLIAKQICLDYPDRDIKMEHQPSTKGLDSFELWKNKSDKILY